MADLADNDDGHDCGVIRPIEEESVQRIVAGQAVTDLASAVKELVDNALDAGSTGINIRLFNQGLDILEVSDDGSGVPPASRPFLAQAHATSKIRSFDDIYSTANSLGFRGEALFCLANLSEKLIIATRTEEEPVGQKMEFNHNGSMKTETVVPAPRKVGTTVAVVKLLSSLPVRRADMERRIVQHRSKMMRMMEGYAIFSVGVRINLMDVVGRKENALLATTANSRKLEQNISSVLGSKFLGSVSPLLVDLKSAMDEKSPKGDWKLEGFLSKAPSDQGNNGAKAGQQFFSINGRPVELPKVARTIGDVWRSHGGKKKFSCILTLTLPNQEYDVNLSPEKREVLLTHEDAICQAIQGGVTEFWTSQTKGQFTPGASQPTAPTASAPAPASSASNLKPPPPKINDMASLARIQESNRKRARELHSQTGPSIALSKKSDQEDAEEMDVDSQYGEHGGGGEDEDQPVGRRAYIRRFKEEQNEQRKLNESQESASCQYGEEHPGAQEQQPPQGESSRVRRRGGFVHDISTAKQWERPGIEDPGADEEDSDNEVKKAPKRQRTNPSQPGGSSPVRPANKLSSMRAAAAMAASFATSDEEAEQSSSRRVTLTLNNEAAEAPPASSTATTAPLAKHKETGTTDGDKVLWMEAQSRFNQSEPTSPEKEIDVLVKSSVSPKQAAFQTPSNRSNPTSNRTNRSQALNLEQFSFRGAGSDKKVGRVGNTAAEKKSAVSPEEFTATPHNDVTKDTKKKSSSVSRRSSKSLQNTQEEPRSASPKEPDRPQATDAATPSAQVPCDVVWGKFSGSEDIVAATKLERQRMEDRKRKLKEGKSGVNLDEEDEEASSKNKAEKVTLSKHDFASMTVVGQFNLGFIVALSKSSSDLWILDQHACDERRNFEKLMTETVMHNQKLIAPMPLELDPWEENCVLDNRELFRKNGFQFLYSEDKPPRHRLSLTALPHSGARDGRKAVTYGAEDVSALCAILGAGGSTGQDDEDVSGGTGVDGSGMYGNNAVRRYASSSQVNGDDADKIITRLPKAIAMFASRACRGSIMIGTSLSKKEMEKVVKSMESLNDPWTCAHGRPTLTNIVTGLHSDLLKDERKVAERISGPTAMSLSQSQEP